MTQGQGGALPPVGANNTAVAQQGAGGMLTNAEAAKRLKVSTKTTGRWRETGFGPPYIKTGAGKNSHVRYPEKELDDWIQKNSMISPTTPANKLMPWVIDNENRIIGPAEGEWGDDVVLISTYEALTEERWVDSGAMKKAWALWEDEIAQARDGIRSSLARCEQEAMDAITKGLGRDSEPGSIL